jgi:uncharacterized protein
LGRAGTRRRGSSIDRKRIIGYDVARALAVFGMVVVNYSVVMNLSANGPHWLLEWSGALEGRAAATFVVLAGVGISLMTRTARLSGDAVALGSHRRVLLKRAVLLFIVGALYTPIWPADILHFYGLYITIGALMLSASDRRLWLSAIAATVVFLVLLVVLDYEAGWNWQTLDYAGLWTARGAIRHLFFNGFHPVFPWVGFLLYGMVLGRVDLTVSRTNRRVLLMGIAAAVAAEVASAYLIAWSSTAGTPQDQEVLGALFGTAPMPPMPLYLIAGGGVATAVIAGCVALTERFRASRIWTPLVATGQLALTIYVAHVVIGMGLLEAFGRLKNQSVEAGLTSAVVFCVAATAFARLWRKRFPRGPLEAVMRRFSRGGPPEAVAQPFGRGPID